MLSLKNIEKTYDKNGISTNALKNVSLNISQGEMVAIMGTSGSGKTTLLNILGGLDTSTSGEFYFREEKISDYNTRGLQTYRKKHIGFVFQNFELMERYTVYENVEMPLLARNIRGRKKKVFDLLEQLGIGELAKKKVNQLSGGQQQRCAIARALIADTDVILADEPTGALDAKTSREIMQLFQKIHNMGKTIIIVTHDRDVADCCQRILQLENGTIVDGSVNDGKVRS